MSSTEKKVAAVLVVALAALIVVYFTIGSGTGGSGGTANPGMPGGHGGGFPEVETMGPEDAKVKIVALVPILSIVRQTSRKKSWKQLDCSLIRKLKQSWKQK